MPDSQEREDFLGTKTTRSQINWETSPIGIVQTAIEKLEKIADDDPVDDDTGEPTTDEGIELKELIDSIKNALSTYTGGRC